MDDAAIDDVVASHLDSWYTLVASWWPPGLPSASDCSGCTSSVVRDVIDLSSWPHDVTHPLAHSFDSILEQLERADPDARRRMALALRHHVDDVLDVLEHIVDARTADLVSTPGWLRAAS
jgi:hypothetical protein